jgi:DNA-directed RNA polymerase specialized sigma24 family protein
LRGAQQGKFPDLSDRDSLWRILFVILEGKVCDWVNHERAAKRGGGRVLNESAVETDDSDLNGPPLVNVAGREPTAEEAAMMAEEVRRLLDVLDDAQLRQVALWKMEGYTNKQIGTKLDCAVATVERRLPSAPLEEVLRPEEGNASLSLESSPSSGRAGR